MLRSTSSIRVNRRALTRLQIARPQVPRPCGEGTDLPWLKGCCPEIQKGAQPRRSCLSGGLFRAVGCPAMRQRFAGRSVARRLPHPPLRLHERLRPEQLEQPWGGPVDQRPYRMIVPIGTEKASGEQQGHGPPKQRSFTRTRLRLGECRRLRQVAGWPGSDAALGSLSYLVPSSS
jgi:hypothetical protein